MELVKCLGIFQNSENLEAPEILQSPDRVYHGTNGYLKVTRDVNPDIKKYLEAFKELGNEIHKDLNQQHPLGYSEVLLNIANGYRQSSAYTFLKPIKERTNLYVVNHTTVTKILFDENKNAVGVVAVTEDGRIKTYLATK